jgi:hypothetical protein
MEPESKTGSEKSVWSARRTSRRPSLISGASLVVTTAESVVTEPDQTQITLEDASDRSEIEQKTNCRSKNMVNPSRNLKPVENGSSRLEGIPSFYENECSEDNEGLRFDTALMT